MPRVEPSANQPGGPQFEQAEAPIVSDGQANWPVADGLEERVARRPIVLIAIPWQLEVRALVADGVPLPRHLGVGTHAPAVAALEGLDETRFLGLVLVEATATQIEVARKRVS